MQEATKEKQGGRTPRQPKKLFAFKADHDNRDVLDAIKKGQVSRVINDALRFYFDAKRAG